MDEVDDLCDGGQRPGAGVEQVERGDGMEVGEDGVDPDDPEHAGAEDDDDSRHYRLAQAAGGGDGAVHEGRDAVGKAHDAHTLHAAS